MINKVESKVHSRFDNEKISLDKYSAGTMMQYRSWVSNPEEENIIPYNYKYPKIINMKQLYSMTSKEVKEHPTKNYWK